MAAEPNWYPDPTARAELRYWNGEKWTDHVSTEGVQSQDPVTARPASTERETASTRPVSGHRQQPDGAAGSDGTNTDIVGHQDSSKPSPWIRLATAFENTAILANSARFTDRGGKFLIGFSDDIQAKLKADDVALMFALMRVHTENKTVACGGIVLADRMLVIWSTGFVRMQTHIIEIWYRDVISTNLEGTDVLTVDAGDSWRFSGFDDMVPVIRDMVAAALQQQFTYTIADTGFLSELSFTEIGMTFEYGN